MPVDNAPRTLQGSFNFAFTMARTKQTARKKTGGQGQRARSARRVLLTPQERRERYGTQQRTFYHDPPVLPQNPDPAKNTPDYTGK